MTIFPERELPRDLARALRMLAPANAFFVANLARIVDVTKLTEGDEEFDYFVPVPANQLHDVTQRIADLKFAVQERFGVGISVMPITVASQALPT